MAYGPFELVSYPCPLCGTAGGKILLRKSGVAVTTTFVVVRCRICDLVRVDPRIPNERIGELYDGEYYCGRGFDRAVDYTAPTSTWTNAENERIIATVESAFGKAIQGARWLDVGCGTGTLIEAVRSRGGAAFGFDDSSAALHLCRAKGIEILTSAELAGMRGSFDVVSAIEVIEHVPDPVEFVRDLLSYARVGGIVYVHTENWNVIRWLPRTPYIMPEGHIQYFTPMTMRKLFARLSLREAECFDRCWFVWRRLPTAVQYSIPADWLTGIRALVNTMCPGFSPFPVGVRTR